MLSWFIGFTLFWIIIGIFMLVGWILNIVKLMQSKEFTPFVVVRIIGIFVPVIGCIIGYMN